jgi:hypothetical protein
MSSESEDDADRIWKRCAFKVTQAWNFFNTFFAETEPYGPKGLLHEIFENRIRFGRDIRLLNISAHAQHAMKSIPRMLTMRWNSFRVCLVCDKIRSAYAQHGLYMYKLFTFYCWLSMRGNSFLVCSVCDEIGSAYAQHAIKSFPLNPKLIWINFFEIFFGFELNFNKS